MEYKVKFIAVFYALFFIFVSVVYWLKAEISTLKASILIISLTQIILHFDRIISLIRSNFYLYN